jgi:alkanesulfonate monooxygenase SsuD/methylene tetrahydromethanopterin reductase-like flavin-dependent oxidoreductase (luciferase family)
VVQTLRFGIALSTSAHSGADPVASARNAEALGFDILTVSDHLVGTHATFETWTLLTWVATATERISLAPLVLGLPYRSPAVTAKMAESLDRLSERRLILGLGGGGNDAEFRALGLDVRRPPHKVEALGEAIEVIRGLWSEPEFSYAGKHFAVHQAPIEPKPGHRIPIWLGTYGPRSVAQTGKLADGWNPSLPYLPPEQAAEKREILLRAAREAGRDPDDITCAYNVTVFVREDAVSNPGIVAGPPEPVARRLAEFVRLGFTTICFWARGGHEAHERLASEVIPLVRDMSA